MNPRLLCMKCMRMRGEEPRCGHCDWKEGTAPDNPQQLPPRTVLDGRYLIGCALGQGGFGITYLGWSLHLERKLAIKEYFPREISTRGDHCTVKPLSRDRREAYQYGLNKFADEGRALARFQDHPGIISVLDFLEENGTAYIVMVYAEGLTFEDYLKAQGGKIPFKDAFRVLIRVMDALREVHGAGMLHRDVSPSNIYISEKGHVRILDFGSTRYLMREQTQNLTVQSKSGYTPWEQYMARGRQGEWTDVYALGATFYRAVTGQRPPDAPDRKEHDDIVWPSHLGVDIPPESEKALMKALAVEVNDRFKDVPEFHKAIQLEGKSAGVQNGSPLLISRCLGAAVGLLCVSTLAFLILWLGANKRIKHLELSGSKTLDPGAQVRELAEERDELTKEKDGLTKEREALTKGRDALTIKDRGDLQGRFYPVFK